MKNTKVNVEYVPQMDAYRLYRNQNPEQTIAYENNLDILKTRVKEEGYILEPPIDNLSQTEREGVSNSLKNLVAKAEKKLAAETTQQPKAKDKSMEI